jgi:hypothetical protein
MTKYSTEEKVALLERWKDVSVNLSGKNVPCEQFLPVFGGFGQRTAFKKSPQIFKRLKAVLPGRLDERVHPAGTFSLFRAFVEKPEFSFQHKRPDGVLAGG